MGTGAQAESPSFVWAPYVPVHLPAFHTTEAENELIEYMEREGWMRALSGMNVTAKVSVLLEKLRTNREEHAAIVKEAREGYMRKAQDELNKRLGELKEGKIVGLVFSLTPPQDYTRVYDTAIATLEIATEEEIKMTPDQIRHLVLDDWDWQREFLASTSQYSGSAQEKLNSY